MSWIVLALFSAVVAGSRRAYEKTLTKHFGNFAMGFIVQSFALVPTLALLFFLPIPDDIWHLPWQFWWPLLIIWFILYPVQTYFFYRSIREGEVSQVTPIKSILPVFNMITSFALIGERPTLFGIIGIIAIVFGTYLLLSEKTRASTEGKKYNLSVVLMILATVCMAIGSTLDKISIAASTPAFYSFVNTLGASIIFLVLIFLYNQKSDLPKIKGFVWPLALLGVFQALSYTATMFAFSKGPTAYVLAIQSAGFLFAVFWGVVLMKEKLSKRRIISLALFIIGLVFISVLS